MKKTILLALWIISVIPHVFAQRIPNGDMELWTTSKLGYDSLINWGSTNSIFYPNISVVKTTDAHTGNFAARMNGTTFLSIIPVPGGIGINASVDFLTLSLKGGYPCTDRPANLEGYFKYLPDGKDTLLIAGVMTKWVGTKRDTVGITVFGFSDSVTTYQHFASPMFYFSNEEPDTGFVIAITSYNFLAAHLNSVMYLDDVAFTFGLGINDPVGNKLSVNVFPNPASGDFHLNFSSSQQASRLEIFDVLGNKMKDVEIDTKELTLSALQWSSGIYFYKVMDKNNNVLCTGKFNVKH